MVKVTLIIWLSLISFLGNGRPCAIVIPTLLQIKPGVKTYVFTEKEYNDLQRYYKGREEDLAMIIGVVMFFLGSLYIVRTEKEKIHLKWATIQLGYAAKAKLHNIRNNYTAFIGLIDEERFDLVKQYAERSAYFFNKALNAWDSKAWTLEMEMQLLDRFYNAERILEKEVTVRYDLDASIDIKRTLLMPEVLTTLLHNSMKHAFRHKTGECIFQIGAWRNGSVLFIEVSDNGHSDEISSYLKEEGSGLFILKRRLVNRLLLAGKRKHIKDCMWIGLSDYGFGTKIIMKFPYEVAA